MDFNDTSCVHYLEVTDQAIVDYIDMLIVPRNTYLVRVFVTNFYAEARKG